MIAIWQCIVGNLLLRLGNSATGVLMGLLLASIQRESGTVPATAVGLLALAGLSIYLFGWEVHRVYLVEILPRMGAGENIDPYAPGWNSLTALLHPVLMGAPPSCAIGCLKAAVVTLPRRSRLLCDLVAHRSRAHDQRAEGLACGGVDLPCRASGEAAGVPSHQGGK